MLKNIVTLIFCLWLYQGTAQDAHIQDWSLVYGQMDLNEPDNKAIKEGLEKKLGKARVAEIAQYSLQTAWPSEIGSSTKRMLNTNLLGNLQLKEVIVFNDEDRQMYILTTTNAQEIFRMSEPKVAHELYFIVDKQGVARITDTHFGGLKAQDALNIIVNDCASGFEKLKGAANDKASIGETFKSNIHFSDSRDSYFSKSVFSLNKYYFIAEWDRQADMQKANKQLQFVRNEIEGSQYEYYNIVLDKTETNDDGLKSYSYKLTPKPAYEAMSTVYIELKMVKSFDYIENQLKAAIFVSMSIYNKK